MYNALLKILDGFKPTRRKMRELAERENVMKEAMRLSGCWSENYIGTYTDGYMCGYTKALEEIAAAVEPFRK